MPIDAIQRGVAELRRCLGEAEASLTPVSTKLGERAAFELQLPEDYLGKARRLRVGFGSSFPHVPATFSVLPWPEFEWPHVMTGGLCLYAEDEQPITDTPEASVRYSFNQFSALLQFNLAGADPAKRKAEFDAEIRSYWRLQHPLADHRLTLVALPEYSGPLEVVSDRPNQQRRNLRYLAASTHGHISTFEKRMGRLYVRPRAPAKAGFYLTLICTPPPKLPPPNSDFAQWIAPYVSPEDLISFQTWLDETRDLGARWVVLALPAGSVALQGFYLTAPGMNRKTRRVFGRRTQRRQTWRAEKPSALSCVWIDVLDPKVIHQRGGEAGAALADKKVVLVGAGSLGGELAMTLARSGIGKLVIVDPDVLEDVNVGRHTLGASDLGSLKVRALADRIGRDIPTAEVIAVPENIQEASSRLDPYLEEADLVVVTTANWPSEAYLWELKAAGTRWPLIQAWSEPHALVGHALIAPGGAVDGRRLFDRGNFRHLMTEWPDHGVIPLPACGRSYIPGTGAALGRIVNMIADCALKVLAKPPLTPTWHFTIGGLEQLEEFQGSYRGPELPKGQAFTECFQDWPAQDG